MGGWMDGYKQGKEIHYVPIPNMQTSPFKTHFPWSQGSVAQHVELKLFSLPEGSVSSICLLETA
jgi:hypothetical protein